MEKSVPEVKFTVSDSAHTLTSASHKEDISIPITRVCLKVVGLWHAKDHVEQRHRKFMLFYTIYAMLYGVVLQTRDFYYSWPNLTDCVYIACNIMYLMVVLFKIAVLYTHRVEFFDLILFTQKNFWHSNYNLREKLILDEYKRLCALFIVILSFCTQGTCAGYMVTPILGNIGKNESERILPFNMWLDFPTGTSPYFEVLFLIQMLCVYHVGVCYICFDNFLCILNLHVASQFQVLQYRLMNLTDILEKERHIRASDESLSRYASTCYQKLRNCVKHHQALMEYCRMLEKIFTLIVLGQVLFLAMIICLVGYQIFLAETPPSRSVSLVLTMAATLCQLLMFTYSCDGLIRQSSNVGGAIFSAPWAIFPMDQIGKSLRKNTTIMIMRTTRSCCLTASGFFPVSLETSTAVLSTAMSYFTLLRQSTLDMGNAHLNS
ncbi:odorant receptor 4-like isoform X1 [Hylaeus anthracinus]|uniref:odorant receptor 4-like isoform X1 n=1 Tax=Hylaeus anthracinus TaxID=313031 RepID=UPI0023B922F7|nr:odorant receptor 4-like isoform X1 [Hylaeus anthracinus]